MSNTGVKQPSGDAAKLMMFEAQKKSMGVAYLLWFFLGGVGAHRFYVGETGTATAMLIIFILSFILSVVGVGLLGFVALGIWCIVDAFLIPGYVRSFNMKLASALS
jgi:TM2 domain-containing membrane protein YozV